MEKASNEKKEEATVALEAVAKPLMTKQKRLGMKLTWRSLLAPKSAVCVPNFAK